MPNKCCVMKGSVDVTHGQHFAVIGDTDTWRERGWNHPKRYPIKKDLYKFIILNGIRQFLKD